MTHTLHKRHYEHDLLKHVDVASLYDPDDLMMSLLLHIINATFEGSERIFIDIFREAMEVVDDPHLLQQMKLFIYQEGNHAMLHRHYCIGLRESTQSIVTQMLSDCDAHFAAIKQRVLKQDTLQDKLYFVIVSEIFASRFSEFFLERYQNKHHQLDPFSSYMYMMHCIEEIEHQSLAMDVYQYLYKEHPHHRPQYVKQLKTFNDVTLKQLGDWLVLASLSWCLERDLPLIGRSKILAWMTAEDGFFPGGELYHHMYSEDFHPEGLQMQHFVRKWEDEWQDELVQRMQKQAVKKDQ